MSDFTIRLVLGNNKLIEFHGPADIIKETTEAIVNAANSSLMGGGGVDGAIHRAGGPAILQECKRIVAEIGSLDAGRAVITTGGRLAAKHVIHTVGPIYRGGGKYDRSTLISCYRECMRLGDDHGITSLSFPSISTGAFGYPVDEAAPVAVSTVLDMLPGTHHLSLVRFVLFDRVTLMAYTKAAETLNSPSYSIEKGLP
jgi:O-acetyl-ADP-ribose deacetylase (regulator of RNase III)